MALAKSLSSPPLKCIGLWPGLLESAYAEPLRLDIMVEKQINIEAKAVGIYNSIFEAQALTYLRLLNLRLALVINFGEKLVKDGIHRVVNGL